MENAEVKQIGVVVKDLGEAMKYYTTGFGIGPFRTFEVPISNATLRGKPIQLKLKVAFARLGSVQLELIEAMPGNNLYWEFLNAKGEGLHHLGFYVTNLEAEVGKFREQGVGVLQSGQAEGTKFAYLDTEKIGGIIFELIQRG